MVFNVIWISTCSISFFIKTITWCYTITHHANSLKCCHFKLRCQSIWEFFHIMNLSYENYSVNEIRSVLEDRKKKFSNFFRIMNALRLNSPGSQELISENHFSKFDRKHAFSSWFRWIWTEIKISSKKCVTGWN